MGMSKTRHIHQRVSERSIKQVWLDQVKLLGVDCGDKIILNAKGIDLAVKVLKEISNEMQRMKSRGGIVLVESGDHEITTYALNSYDRKHSTGVRL